MVITQIKRIFVKVAMLIVWVIIIAAFLYAPDFLLFNAAARSINIFTWSGLFDTRYIALFERKTGIKVNFSYYESNEELLVKLRAMQGRGYDLIIPSDYAVDILKSERLLQKLDKTKLPFYSHINPLLLGHYFDVHNEYSLPFEWAVFGLGIDKAFFEHKQLEPSWRLVFDPHSIPSKIVMPNDPLVAIPLAALYLFGSVRNIDQEKLHQIQIVLSNQKKYIEAYADFRADYLLITKNVPLAVASSAYIWRSMRNYPAIDFVVPKEGSLITIENVAIPITSKKQDLVYEFLKFMYNPVTVEHQFNTSAFFPVTTDVLTKLTLTDSVKKILTLSPYEFSKFEFFKYSNFKKPITEQALQDLWVTVKS